MDSIYNGKQVGTLWENIVLSACHVVILSVNLTNLTMFNSVYEVYDVVLVCFN